MSRHVSHDGSGALQIRFPFNRGLVDRIKTLPNRRWNAAERFWWVPDGDVVLLVDLLQGDDFRFDQATRELYRDLGGTAQLDDAVPAATSGSPQRGLFDGSAEDAPATSGDYTVSALNEKVRAVLESAFPEAVWLVGEISGYNKNAHRKHVGFHLVEREADGRAVSEVSVTLFERTRREVERQLAAAGEPFRLEDEVGVRVRARIELYVPWGSYRVIVEELDVHYTLGEAARRREEIVRRLTEAGLVGMNTAIALPPLPLRVGLITSLGSDAYNDVLRTLQESTFAFELTAHGARVQGRNTEPSVLNALDWFRERSSAFDALLICRGGGSRTDLAWFDSEALGRAVATFPIPVVVGIGHEQDQSVLDAVGHRAKTPTSAAALLVETTRNGIERLESRGRRILDLAAEAIRGEREAGVERARRLALTAGNRLQTAAAALTAHRQRVVLGASGVLSGGRQEIVRWTTGIPQGARHGITDAREALRRTVRALGPRALRLLRADRERDDSRSRRLALVDPRRVLERGYAILRRGDGRVLTRRVDAPPGTMVEAELREGRLRLRAEDEQSGNGGE